MFAILLTCILSLTPTSTYQQALSDYYLGEWERAKQGLSAELLGSDAGDALYNLAAINYLEGKYEEVRNLLPQEVKAKGPGEIYFLVGNSYLAERDPQGGPIKTNISKALDLFGKAPKTLLRDHSEAAALYMQGSYDAAWDRIKNYITNPNCPKSVLALAGLIRKGMKQDTEAVSLLAGASTNDDAPTPVLVAYARLLNELNRAAEANQVIARAAARPDIKAYASILVPISDKAMPADSGIMSKVARARLGLWLQQPSVALTALVQAGNSDADVLFLRGSAAGLLSRYQEAKDNLEAALRLNPSGPLASRIKAQLVVIYFRGSDSKGVYDLLQREANTFFGSFPVPFPNPTLEDGIWYFDTLKPVEDWLANINSASPTDPYAALNLGSLLTMEGKYPDAARAFADGMNRLSNSSNEDAAKAYDMYKQIYSIVSTKKAGEVPDIISKGLSQGSLLIGVNFFPPNQSSEMLYYVP